MSKKTLLQTFIGTKLHKKVKVYILSYSILIWKGVIILQVSIPERDWPLIARRYFARDTIFCAVLTSVDEYMASSIPDTELIWSNLHHPDMSSFS